jgi:hypothetical protein
VVGRAPPLIVSSAAGFDDTAYLISKTSDTAAGVADSFWDGRISLHLCTSGAIIFDDIERHLKTHRHYHDTWVGRSIPLLLLLWSFLFKFSPSDQTGIWRRDICISGVLRILIIGGH